MLSHWAHPQVEIRTKRDKSPGVTLEQLPGQASCLSPLLLPQLRHSSFPFSGCSTCELEQVCFHVLGDLSTSGSN